MTLVAIFCSFGTSDTFLLTSSLFARAHAHSLTNLMMDYYYYCYNKENASKMHWDYARDIRKINKKNSVAKQIF